MRVRILFPVRITLARAPAGREVESGVVLGTAYGLIADKESTPKALVMTCRRMKERVTR